MQGQEAGPLVSSKVQKNHFYGSSAGSVKLSDPTWNMASLLGAFALILAKRDQTPICRLRPFAQHLVEVSEVREHDTRGRIIRSPLDHAGRGRAGGSQ